MSENDFKLLCESIRQAGEIRRGERKPARTFKIEDPDAKAIRERLGILLMLSVASWGLPCYLARACSGRNLFEVGDGLGH